MPPKKAAVIVDFDKVPEGEGRAAGDDIVRFVKKKKIPKAPKEKKVRVKSEKKVKKAGAARKNKGTTFAIDDPNSLHQIWKCYMNIGIMLRNRGCAVDEVEEIINADFNTFKTEVEGNDMIVPPFTLENVKRNYLTHIIIYPLDQVQKKNVLNHIYEMLQVPLPKKDQVHNIIFISTTKSHQKIKKIIADRPYAKDYGKIVYEAFDISAFFEDKISNIMVDPMRELNNEEIDRIKEIDPGFNPVQLPILMTSDPMCMYYGFTIGTIVEIIRTDEVFGIQTAYRIVQSARQIISRNG